LNAFATCPAFRELSGTLYREANWLVTDQLGTPRMIADKSGSLGSVKRHDYLPFGEELSAGLGGRTTAQGYTGDTVRQKFTSKERDNETGLDYFIARYYSSTQGRFTSPDEFSGGPDELYSFVDDASANPTFYADLTNPQSLNKYQYSYNNPLRYVDPDGHDPADPSQDDTCPCVKGPTDQQILEAGKAVIETVGKYTGLFALADALREYGPPAAKAVGRATVTVITKIGEQGNNPCNECVIQQAQNGSQTEEKTKNVADSEKKGIPKDQLGPSGKPKVNVVKHPTEKRAKDAARNQGQGRPAKDASPKKGGPHYHPTNRDGSRKKGKQNVHHEYPN
jgi:RHS repeat-associated protein